MITRLLLTSFLSAACISGGAQSMLEASGEIPEDFLFTSRLELIDKYEGQHIFNSSRTERKESDFLKRAEFVTSELLLSGDVLFGDPITDYLEEIRLTLLANSPGLLDEIRVYPLRSRTANAHMSAKGILFVTTGLLAQVENESQLAYIIAHEIAHHTNGHIVKGFHNRLSNDYTGRRNQSTTDLLKVASYSREMELEADMEAIHLVLKTEKYSLEDAMGVFDVLLFAYLPYDEVTFDPRWILPDEFDIPLKLQINSVNPIRRFEDFEDTASTHPNIKRRKEAFTEELLGMENLGGGTAFPQGEEKFNEIQQMARMNVIRQDIITRNYTRAIYNSFLMQRSMPDGPNEEIVTQTGYALHALAAYKSDDSYEDISIKAGESEGEVHRVYHIIENMPAEDLAALAVAYNYHWSNEFPDNELIRGNYTSSLRELVRFHEKSLEDYTATPETHQKVLDTLSTEEYEQLSKVEKIRYRRSVENVVEGDFNSLFYSLKNDSLFVLTFTSVYDQYQENLKNNSGKSERELRELAKEEEKDNSEDVALNLDRIIYMAPQYFYGDIRYTEPLQVSETYELRKKVDEITQEILELSGLSYAYISPDELAPESTQDYNDYALAKNWLYERFRHVNREVNISTGSEAWEMADRLGSDYIVVPYLVTVRLPKTDILNRLISSVIFYPSIPFTLAYLLTPRHSTMYSCYVFNLRTGNALLANNMTFDETVKRDYLTNMIYDTVHQIKQAP